MNILFPTFFVISAVAPIFCQSFSRYARPWGMGDAARRRSQIIRGAASSELHNNFMNVLCCMFFVFVNV